MAPGQIPVRRQAVLGLQDAAARLEEALPSLRQVEARKARRQVGTLQRLHRERVLGRASPHPCQERVPGRRAVHRAVHRQQRAPAVGLQFPPQIEGALHQRHVLGRLEVGLPRRPRGAVRRAQRMRGRVGVQPQHPRPALRSMAGGGASHDAEADNDDIECLHGLFLRMTGNTLPPFENVWERKSGIRAIHECMDMDMDMDWDDLRFFLAVARAGSLTAAARDLGVSQPTVSRRLAALDSRLGVKLLERTAAGYVLAPAGAEIFESAQQVADEIDAIRLRVFGRDRRISGPIRLTCTEVIANLYLAPHLAQVAIAVYAARGAGLERRRPDSWTWIGWQDEAYTRMLVSTPFPSARIRHRVDDMQTMRALVRNGVGVTVLPCYMADIDVGLERVLPEPLIENELDLWVLIHPDVRNVARVRRFSEFLTETVVADRDLFEGRRLA